MGKQPRVRSQAPQDHKCLFAKQYAKQTLNAKSGNTKMQQNTCSVCLTYLITKVRWSDGLCVLTYTSVSFPRPLLLL